jgi:hypothetical protein
MSSNLTNRRAITERGIRVLRLCLAAAAATMALSTSGAVWAAPIECGALRAHVENKKSAKLEAVSADEAATAEAVNAAKQCLANIARAINAISIPGVAFSVDFSGILNNMINRACQVVTSRIDEAGRVVNGTVSGAANRFIGDVNSTLNLPSGVLTGGANASVTGSAGAVNSGLTGSIAVPGVAAPVTPAPSTLWDRVTCTMRGDCP